MSKQKMLYAMTHSKEALAKVGRHTGGFLFVFLNTHGMYIKENNLAIGSISRFYSTEEKELNHCPL